MKLHGRTFMVAGMGHLKAGERESKEILYYTYQKSSFWRSKPERPVGLLQFIYRPSYKALQRGTLVPFSQGYG